ncbi:MAG: sugar phosphate nucleotidyltransferase, partial [Desulfurococcaceae archaeon]
MVLAGGVGSRLHPLTKVVPKPLIPFAGSPLVEY